MRASGNHTLLFDLQVFHSGNNENHSDNLPLRSNSMQLMFEIEDIFIRDTTSLIHSMYRKLWMIIGLLFNEHAFSSKRNCSVKFSKYGSFVVFKKICILGAFYFEWF